MGYRRKKKTAQDCRKHFKKRAKDRYGLHINRKARLEIEEMIRTGQSTVVEVKSRTKVTHLVNYKGTPLLIGYDKKRHTVVTALQHNTTEYLKE